MGALAVLGGPSSSSSKSKDSRGIGDPGIKASIEALSEPSEVKYN